MLGFGQYAPKAEPLRLVPEVPGQEIGAVFVTVSSDACYEIQPVPAVGVTSNPNLY